MRALLVLYMTKYLLVAGNADKVIGTADDRGESVTDGPVHPPEVAATIYSALGIDFEKYLYTPQNRPVRILPECEPIKELWG